MEGSEHYKVGGIEVLDILRAKLTRDQYEGFLLGNIIKYALRYNWTEEKASDLAKCHHYCQLLRDTWLPAENTEVRLDTPNQDRKRR